MTLDPRLRQGEFFVRWTPANDAEYDGLTDLVRAFDAGPLPAAQGAAGWLREASLEAPQQSVPRLYLADGELVGFYALAMGQVELRPNHRKTLNVTFPNQPAVLLTWVARTPGDRGSGRVLFEHALATGRQAAGDVAATVLALDPFDEPTAEMWRRVYGFRNSKTRSQATELPRLWLPLHDA